MVEAEGGPLVVDKPEPIEVTPKEAAAPAEEATPTPAEEPEEAPVREAIEEAEPVETTAAVEIPAIEEEPPPPEVPIEEQPKEITDDILSSILDGAIGRMSQAEQAKASKSQLRFAEDLGRFAPREEEKPKKKKKKVPRREIVEDEVGIEDGVDLGDEATGQDDVDVVEDTEGAPDEGEA
jgi:hypothetical protein